jgi:hypothetical protein
VWGKVAPVSVILKAFPGLLPGYTPPPLHCPWEWLIPYRNARADSGAVPVKIVGV